MAGSGDENIGKKIGKLETGGLRASISRSPASYLQFPGGEMGRGQCQYWDGVTRKFIKQCCPRGTQDMSRVLETKSTAALWPTTPVFSGGRKPSSQNQILTPFRPRLQPFSFFACLIPPSGHWIPFWRDSSIFWVWVILKYCLFSYFIKRLVFELDYSSSSSDSNMLV